MDLNHYTKADAVLNIIQEDCIKMRATRFAHLNDSMEYRWINEKITPQKEKLSKELNLTYDAEQHTYPYVICFCDLEDEHLMWKIYGNEGKGFILTFDYGLVEKFSKGSSKNDYLLGIVYANEQDWEKKFQIAVKIFNQVEDINSSVDFDNICGLIKRDIYSHENETRYLRCNHDIFEAQGGNGSYKIDYDNEEYKDLEFMFNEFGIKPYIEIDLPKEALRSITVGYGYNFESQAAALRLLLKSRGYENVEIKKSVIIP